MEEIFLPVLSHFQNKNIWLGSAGRLRFKITPGEGELTAEVWDGPMCYELSAVRDTKAFPLDETGLAGLKIWLGEQGG